MSDKENISIGDYVKHINSPFLNGGLPLSVVETTKSEAKISYFDHEGVHKEEWVSKVYLTVQNKAQGGFRDAGEAP